MHISLALSSPSDKVVTFYRIAEKMKSIIRQSIILPNSNHFNFNVESVNALVLDIIESLEAIDKSKNTMSKLADDLKKLKVGESNKSHCLLNQPILNEREKILKNFSFLLKRDYSYLITDDLPPRISKYFAGVTEKDLVNEKDLASLSEAVTDIIVTYKFQKVLKSQAKVTLVSINYIIASNIMKYEIYLQLVLYLGRMLSHIAAQRGLLEHVRLLVDTYEDDIESESHEVVRSLIRIY